jgi:hypothetical protein
MMTMNKDAASTNGNVTADRAERLCRLLTLLGQGPQTRAALTRQLRLNIRGFYRDLEVLRAAGITVELLDGHYVLGEDAEGAIERLPFPDPGLTIGDARQLAKGKSGAHRKIQAKLERIER